jgi:hypothetical protein
MSAPGSTRRGFLRLAGTTAALAGVARLRAVPAAAAAAAGGPGTPRFFSSWETEILTQIAERMVDTGEAGAPRLRDTAAVATIDRIAGALDPAISGQLPLAIRLFEFGPLLFDRSFARFSRLDDAGKDASLRAWMTSGLALRRQGFLAFRNLALLGYYSQDETWPLIGYRGPLLAGARVGS